MPRGNVEGVIRPRSRKSGSALRSAVLFVYIKHACNAPRSCFCVQQLQGRCRPSRCAIQLSTFVGAAQWSRALTADASAKLLAASSPNDNMSLADDEAAGFHLASKRTMLESDALHQYILDTSVYPRESPYQKEIRELTQKKPWGLQACPPDEGQFLMLLLKIMNAKNVLELGVYTGYSLLSAALALPDDGKIIGMDIHRESYELGAAVIEKAGLSHKVDFREGLILPQLDKMLLEEKNHGFFDFVFVDADKENYLNYHDRVMKLVKVGGVIGYDNTLWAGSLAAPEGAQYPWYVRHGRPFLLEFNRVLAVDERIEISQLPLGDGITICRRTM